MKNFKKNKFSAYSAVVAALFVPGVVLAQDSSSKTYTLLQKLPDIGGSVAPDSVSSYLQFLFSFGIGIAIALSVIMIVIGGAQYLSTDAVFGKSEGKKKIIDALWGLLLALCSYLILYTINPNLLNLNLSIKQLTGATGPTGRLDTGGIGATGGQPAQIWKEYVLESAFIKTRASFIDNGNHYHVIFKIPPGSGRSESLIREELDHMDVGIGGEPCEGQTQNCVNVAYLSMELLEKLKILKGECGCELKIVGGTEQWRLSHGANRPVIDLLKNSKLNAFILEAATKPEKDYSGPAID
ncbi:MAG: hypothetical protein AAB355_02295 [Patescibacteria group bacterium]